MTDKQLDWLLETALFAISKAKPEMRFWCDEKLCEERDSDRLKALRFICNSLDREHKRIVCDALCISFDDLEATKRVLHKI
jgi:hypothetical protein